MKSCTLADWFFQYKSTSISGGFDIREVVEWFSEPDLDQVGYRVYIKGGRNHWLTQEQLGAMLELMKEFQ